MMQKQPGMVVDCLQINEEQFRSHLLCHANEPPSVAVGDLVVTKRLFPPETC